MTRYCYIQQMSELIESYYTPRRMQDIYGDLEAFYETVFYNIAVCSAYDNFSQQYQVFMDCVESDLLDLFETFNRESFSASLCKDFEETFKRCCQAVYDHIDPQLQIDLARILRPYYSNGELPSIIVKVIYSHTRNELIVTYTIESASIENGFGKK